MSLKATRKILSVICIVIIAAGGCLCASATAVKTTLCSESYMQKHLTSDKVMAQCKKNFDDRIEALAVKSSIPVRAFEAVSNFSEITSDSPVRRLFDGHDTTLYTKDTIEKFEQLCTEYLDGNSIKYDKKLVHNTADEAAKIYADCYGLKNTDGLAAFIYNFNDNYESIVSVSFLMMILPVVLIFLLYKRPSDVMLRVFSAFTAEGITLIFTGAMCLILKLGRSPNIYPLIYAQAVGNVFKSVFVFMMIAGFIIAALSICANVAVFKKRKQDYKY
ncbi:MAG: hypothetical protein PUE08_05865 [Eubacteriales bacterium]|nr:hypothetical protein [Eubacteriales bacterium]